MDSFLAYIQQLQLMFFFSGYPLVYAIVILIAGNQRTDKIPQNRSFKSRILWILPYSYALVGTLYIGFLLKDLYPDYSPSRIAHSFHLPLLVTWGILTVLFWIPSLAKKKLLTLIHSLVFFFFLVRDTVLQLSGDTSDKDNLKNDMKVFTDSFLLNAGTLVILILFSFFLHRNKKDKGH